MAKIAAVILPSSRGARLPDLRRRLCRPLCLYSGHRLEIETFEGERTACALLRVAPDPLNPEPQPCNREPLAGVACGYYLSAAQAAGDSTARLTADLARDGVTALPDADGVYAFACWDAQHECLIAGVDKLGMRPLYWAALPGGGYAVASEIKALVCLMDDLKTNWPAWEEQLTFGFLFGNHTLFEGIQRFGMAETITFRHDRSDSRVVENFLDTIDIVDRPFDTFLAQQQAVFGDTMSRLAGLYDARDSTMLTLSGGYDSRRALGWLLDQGISPTVYNVPNIRADGREFEGAIAREVCRRVGLDGRSVSPVSADDRIQLRLMRDLATDFESDEHSFAIILAMGLDCHDKVNFDGLAAGTQLSASFVSRAYFEPGGQERFIASWPRSARAWLKLPEHDAPPLEARIRAELEQWGGNPNRFAYFYMLSRTRREVALAPLSVQANVFESLCPYLDRDMMRSALSFPPERKIDADVQLRSIKALHPVLGGIPSIYSPQAVGKSPHWRRSGDAARWARRDLLKNATHVGAATPAWSPRLEQRLRFRLGRLLAASGIDHRLRWEFGKAAKIGQLHHFGQVTTSPEAYQSAIDALATAYGARIGWQTLL